MEPPDSAAKDPETEASTTSKPTASRWSALDGLEQAVHERYRLQQEKVKAFNTQREAERAHSRYLRNTSQTSPYEQRQARSAAESWRKKHEINKRPPAMPPMVRRIPLATPRASTATSAGTSGTPQTPVEIGGPERRPPTPDSGISVLWDSHASSSTSPIILDQQPHHCPVLNCEMKLTGETQLEQHLAKGCHSPCNPYLHLLDGELKKTASSTHICPVCRATFQTGQLCLEHMLSDGHKTLMRPLAVAAYACRQCLALYPEFIACRLHMERAQHYKYMYPYTDDSGCADIMEPVAVPEGMLSAYIQQCQSTPWQVQCLDCGTDNLGKAAVRQHIEQKHIVVASSDFSPAEAFAMLLQPYTCVQCLRLFSDLPAEGLCSPHQCGEDVVGLIIDNDCRTFQEYLCRFSLGVDADPATVDLTEEAGAVGRRPSQQNVSIVSISSALSEHDDSVQLEDFEVVEAVGEKAPPARQAGQLNVIGAKRKSSDEDEDGSMGAKKCKRSPEKGPPGLPGDRNTIKLKEESTSGIFRKPASRLSKESVVPATSKVTPPRPLSTRSQNAVQPSSSSNPPDSLTTLSRALELLPVPSTSSPCRPTPTPSFAKNCEAARSSTREPPRPKASCDPKSGAVSPERLSTMKQIIFLDLDNWANFFPKLRGPLPEGTFVWAFHGGAMMWKEPHWCPAFKTCRKAGCFYMQPRSGQTKNAADFALCLMVGRMDALLPKPIPFTILSGDKGFLELQRQMESTERRTVVIDPHHKTVEEVYILIQSVADL